MTTSARIAYTVIVLCAGVLFCIVLAWGIGQGHRLIDQQTQANALRDEFGNARVGAGSRI
jgi:hypothetical protein